MAFVPHRRPPPRRAAPWRAALVVACMCNCGPGTEPAQVEAPVSTPREAPAPAKPLTIIDRPITFDSERTELTIAYRKQHQGDATAGMSITPRVIILHYTDSDSADATWRYFDRARITSDRRDVASASELNVSAHFLVDRDGTTWRLMPETWFARHCIGLNHVAVGVENVGDGEASPLTDAQVEANAALVRYLVRRHPTITHLIGHHEYREMERSPLFRELDRDYRTEKDDPGPAYMERVRARVRDLGLEGPPPPGL